MFNNQPTQVLVTFHEDDNLAQAQLINTATRWASQINLVTGNDGPFPTAVICFEGINALAHFCSRGIMAYAETDEVNLFLLDDTVVDVKDLNIYNAGQRINNNILSPNGKAFGLLAGTYCHMTHSRRDRSTPRGIPRDKSWGFMDLSESDRPRRRETGRRGFSHREDFADIGRFIHQDRHIARDVKITLKDTDAFLSIGHVDAELIERTTVEGGTVFKFHHPAILSTREESINHGLMAANLNSAWMDRENCILNIVVPDDNGDSDATPVLTFDIRLDVNPEDNNVPVVVLEDKDGDLYPHIANEDEDGYHYQSDLLRGLTKENISDLTTMAKSNGLAVDYDTEVGAIRLTKSTAATSDSESLPELAIKDNQLLLGGVPAQVLETGDREFKIIFGQDLPMNKYDYAAVLRNMLLGRHYKGFNSNWNLGEANVLSIQLELGDNAKSVKTMRALVEASKLATEAIIENGTLYLVVEGAKNPVEVFEEANGIFNISADLWLEDASKELIDTLVESLGKHLRVNTPITYEVDVIPHILNLNLGSGNTNRGAKQRLRDIKAN